VIIKTIPRWLRLKKGTKIISRDTETHKSCKITAITNRRTPSYAHLDVQYKIKNRNRCKFIGEVIPGLN
jgi:hypothetical protein